MVGKKNAILEAKKPSKKRKVVTLEEKCIIFQKILQDQHEIYSLKELETLIPRRSQGVIHAMLIKELIEHMSSEDMIKVEKCGNINVYYSFPFISDKENQLRYQRLEETEKSLKQTIVDLNGKSNFWKDPANMELFALNVKYQSLITQMENVEAKRASLLQKYKNDDTGNLENQLTEQNQQMAKLKDNIYMMIDHVAHKFPHIEKTSLFDELEIPEDLLDGD